MPTLSHRIRLNPTPDQETYFRKAAGTARFVYNWALAEWNRQYQAHVEDPSRPKPSAAAIKRQFNELKGEVFDAPKPLKNALRRLKIRQRRVARKAKGSKNREKAKMQVSRLHERITNLRNDWTHKITTKLVRENQAIGLEDLNVSGMLRNHKLARAIADIGFGEIRRQVTYKALRYASELVLYPRFAPSSKKCHVCGHVLATLSLSVREWTCPHCGDFHDRDLNAAKVIEQYARDSLVLC